VRERYSASIFELVRAGDISASATRDQRHPGMLAGACKDGFLPKAAALVGLDRPEPSIGCTTLGILVAIRHSLREVAAPVIEPLSVPARGVRSTTGLVGGSGPQQPDPSTARDAGVTLVSPLSTALAGLVMVPNRGLARVCDNQQR